MYGYFKIGGSCAPSIDIGRGIWNEKTRKKHGFTLLEMIVVLLIIAVLAAILMPALTGYIEKTKKEKILSEARNVWVSAQAALTECYGLHEESFSIWSSCRFSVTIDGE